MTRYDAAVSSAAVSDSLKLARVAFTGRLASMTRREAAGLVKAAGGALVTTVSRRTSLLVVGMDGWPLLPDGTVSRKLGRAETLNRQGARIRIVSEAAFLEMAGLTRRAPDLRKSFPAAHVSSLLGIDEASLRRWELFGLIRAEQGLYDFQDLVSLRTVAELVAGGADPATISRSMRGLAAVLPGTERPLSQLKIVVEDRGTLLAELGDRLVAPDGQLVLDFGARPGAERPPVETPLAAPVSADEWLERGQRCEDEERLPEAIDAYRSAVALRPDLAEAHFNLGNVLRGLGRLDGAEERFRMAVDLDPDLAAAWYNLADLMEENQRLDEAVACLLRAVEASPSFADAHFNLAYCYDQLGRPTEAAGHWRAYLKLDPDSEWAEIARRHLP